VSFNFLKKGEEKYTHNKNIPGNMGNLTSAASSSSSSARSTTHDRTDDIWLKFPISNLFDRQILQSECAKLPNGALSDTINNYTRKDYLYMQDKLRKIISSDIDKIREIQVHAKDFKDLFKSSDELAAVSKNDSTNAKKSSINSSSKLKSESFERKIDLADIVEMHKSYDVDGEIDWI